MYSATGHRQVTTYSVMSHGQVTTYSVMGHGQIITYSVMGHVYYDSLLGFFAIQEGQLWGINPW